MINNVKINEGDKSLSLILDIDNIPATQFFNRQLLSQVHEGWDGSAVAWLQMCRKRHVVEVTFQPNDADYLELADHLETGAIKYSLHQARTICNWIYDNIRKCDDGIDWATVFLEIIGNAE